MLRAALPIQTCLLPIGPGQSKQSWYLTKSSCDLKVMYVIGSVRQLESQEATVHAMLIPEGLETG
jgi:hypothetical protein